MRSTVVEVEDCETGPWGHAAVLTENGESGIVRGGSG